MTEGRDFPPTLVAITAPTSTATSRIEAPTASVARRRPGGAPIAGPVRATGWRTRGRGRCRGEIKRGVAGNDRQLELLQARPGLEPKLCGQSATELLVEIERLGLPSATVQRQHQLPPQPLAQRIAPDRCRELPDQLAVGTQRQIRLEPLLQRGKPQLLELGDRRLRERLIAEICQRCPSPHRQRGSQRAGGLLRVPCRKLLTSALEQTTEPVEIQLPGLDAKHVTSPARRQQTIRPCLALYPKGPTQPRHRHMHGVQRRRRRPLAPQAIDQHIGRDDLIGVQQQHRQQNPLPLARHRNVNAVAANLKRAKDSVIQACAPIPARAYHRASHAAIGRPTPRLDRPISAS